MLPVAEDDGDERGPDQNDYGLHKLLCEDLLRAAHAERGFPATTVALSMVFGPHNTLLPLIGSAGRRSTMAGHE